MEVLHGGRRTASVKRVITRRRWRLFTDRLELSRWSNRVHIVRSAGSLIHHCLLTRHFLFWRETNGKKNSVCAVCMIAQEFQHHLQLLFKHYLTAKNFKDVISPPAESHVSLHINFSFPSLRSWKSHWFSTCGPAWLIRYSCSDLSQQLTFNCRGALMHAGLMAFSSVSALHA